MGRNVITTTTTNVSNVNLQDQEESFVYGSNSRLQNADRDGFLSGDQNSVGDVSIHYGDPDTTERLLEIIENSQAEEPVQVTIGGDLSGSVGVTDSSTTANSRNVIPMWAKIIGAVIIAVLLYKVMR